jgi:hypothetical protein
MRGLKKLKEEANWIEAEVVQFVFYWLVKYNTSAEKKNKKLMNWIYEKMKIFKTIKNLIIKKKL